MATTALTTKDIPGWTEEKAAKKAARARAAERHGALSTKTFEELTGQEKDLLLKAVAVQLGLIADSDDS